jgi:hypothetical protein
MTLFRPFVFRLVVCAATMFALITMATEPLAPPSNEIMKQCIYLAHTPLVEAASDIAGDTYILTFRLEARKPMNVPSTIGIGVGSTHFLVPEVLFKNQYAMAATTHLFKVDDEHVGFVVFCGGGERARRCLFRINTRKHVVRREDWSPDGKLQANTEYLPLAKAE